MTVPRSPGKLRVLVTRHAVSTHAPPLHASTANATTCQYASSTRLPPVKHVMLQTSQMFGTSERHARRAAAKQCCDASGTWLEHGRQDFTNARLASKVRTCAFAGRTGSRAPGRCGPQRQVPKNVACGSNAHGQPAACMRASDMT